MEHRDRDNRGAPPPSTQTSRALPTHTGRPAGAGRPSKTANVEGPIVPGTFVTQRFERTSGGEMFERKIAADLILLLGAVVESKGYTAKIRVDVFDGVWARYDAGDYGSGAAGNAVYGDLEELPPVRVVGTPPGAQRIELADPG